MSLPGSTIILMFLSSLLCLPPYLAFLLFARSRRRAMRHGLATASLRRGGARNMTPILAACRQRPRAVVTAQPRPACTSATRR